MSQSPVARIAILYPWTNFREQRAGAAIRCNLLANFLSACADIRVLQCGPNGATPFGRFMVEDVREPTLEILPRRLFRLPFYLGARQRFGQELLFWYFVNRGLDPIFRARVRQAVRWADVVLLEYPFWASFVAPMCRAAGKRLVLSNHDVLSEQIVGSRLLRRWVERREVAAQGLADAVVTVSASDRDWFGARGVPSVAIPNPIDHDRLARAPSCDPRVLLRRLYGIDLPPGPICLFVGSRHPPNVEAADRLRTIAEQVAPTVPDSVFVVAGDCVPAEQSGPWRALGAVDPVVLALLYHAAALVLVPLTGGSGSSIKTVEAMSAGKAVLGTSFCFRGLDIPPDCCVREDNFARWPSLIGELLGNPIRRLHIGALARQAARRFDYRRAFAPYLDLIGLPNTPADLTPRDGTFDLAGTLIAKATELGCIDLVAQLMRTPGLEPRYSGDEDGRAPRPAHAAVFERL